MCSERATYAGKPDISHATIKTNYTYCYLTLHRQKWEDRRLTALARIYPPTADSHTVKNIHLRCKGLSCPFAYDEGIRESGGTDPLILSSVLHILVA